jgi:transposase-like protein
MDNDGSLLRTEERIVLQQLARQSDIDGQRATALLALDQGKTQALAAEESGLTINQVRYFVKKFREERLLAFPDAIGLLPSEIEIVEENTDSSIPEPRKRRLNRLLTEVDDLVQELKVTLPEAGQYPYSPLKMLTLVRDTAVRYTPDIQISLLEPFEDMTREDLVDPETWKGIAYMIAYSAQFQASHAKDVLNERLPDPVKPDSVTERLYGGLDKVTPESVKNMIANLEGTSPEDLLDPDTWKGLAYMIGYSAQFQAGKTKDMLNEQLPDPLKPNTIFGFLKSSIERITPETAKEILASFDGATKEDLLDPETWKGVWYMLNYSLQFQAEQFRARINGKAEDDNEA